MTELEALTPEKLAELLGRTGRARAVWHAMLQGKDPFEDPELSRPVRARLGAQTSPTHLFVEMVLSMWSAADGWLTRKEMAQVSENELLLPCSECERRELSTSQAASRHS